MVRTRAEHECATRQPKMIGVGRLCRMPETTNTYHMYTINVDMIVIVMGDAMLYNGESLLCT